MKCQPEKQQQQKKKKSKRGAEVDERSREHEGVKGGALDRLSAIRRVWLALRRRRKKKKKEHQMPSDLKCSRHVYNHKGPASEWKTVLK